jgi:hypothetical protein
MPTARICRKWQFDVYFMLVDVWIMNVM